MGQSLTVIERSTIRRWTLLGALQPARGSSHVVLRAGFMCRWLTDAGTPPLMEIWALREDRR